MWRILIQFVFFSRCDDREPEIAQQQVIISDWFNGGDLHSSFVTKVRLFKYFAVECMNKTEISSSPVQDSAHSNPKLK